MENNNLRIKASATTFDRIMSFVLEEIPETDLQPGELEIYKRWLAAYSMLLELDTCKEAVTKLCKAFPEISERTAYRDVRNAQMLFGDVNKASKEGLRHILSEQCKDAMKIALKEKDMKSYALLMSNMIKIHGLDKDDPHLPDFTMLQQHTFIINLPPENEKVLNALVRTGAVNLGDLIPEKDIMDIEFEEDKDAN